MRPHVLGIDDRPFNVHDGGETPIVGAMTEGADLVEAVAVTHFPVDGDEVTTFPATWVTTYGCIQRCRRSYSGASRSQDWFPFAGEAARVCRPIAGTCSGSDPRTPRSGPPPYR
jgi:hypothetical protein